MTFRPTFDRRHFNNKLSNWQFWSWNAILWCMTAEIPDQPSWSTHNVDGMEVTWRIWSFCKSTFRAYLLILNTLHSSQFCACFSQNEFNWQITIIFGYLITHLPWTMTLTCLWSLPNVFCIEHKYWSSSSFLTPLMVKTVLIPLSVTIVIIEYRSSALLDNKFRPS